MSGEWVACSDRLPDDARDLVPVATDGVAGGVMSRYDGGWCFQSGVAAVIPPTHWFDVPAPPSLPDPDAELRRELVSLFRSDAQATTDTATWLASRIMPLIDRHRPRLDAYGIPDTLEQVGWTWVSLVRDESCQDPERRVCFDVKRPEAQPWRIDRRVVYAKRLPDEGVGR